MTTNEEKKMRLELRGEITKEVNDIFEKIPYNLRKRERIFLQISHVKKKIYVHMVENNISFPFDLNFKFDSTTKSFIIISPGSFRIDIWFAYSRVDIAIF
jgi:hypothetical protein